VESKQILMESEKTSLESPPEILSPIDPDLTPTFTKHPRSQGKDFRESMGKGQFNLIKAQLFTDR